MQIHLSSPFYRIAIIHCSFNVTILSRILLNGRQDSAQPFRHLLATFILQLTDITEIPSERFSIQFPKLIKLSWIYLYIRLSTSAAWNIQNWSSQLFSKDYGLAAYTAHVVCVSFIREWWDLQFNVESEWRIFEKLFHGRDIYSQSFCQKSVEK